MNFDKYRKPGWGILLQHYLLSDASTTLNRAGRMIDQCEELAARHEPHPLREECLDAACIALGQRNSLDVRLALRDFWETFP